MTVKELRDWLDDFVNSVTIDLMIETEDGQWQFPMTHIAYSDNSKKVILISENRPTDSEEQKP